MGEPLGVQPVNQLGRSWTRMRAMARRSSRDTCIGEKPTRVIEALKPFNPTVIQTSLSHDREEELACALQS